MPGPLSEDFLFLVVPVDEVVESVLVVLGELLETGDTIGLELLGRVIPPVPASTAIMEETDLVSIPVVVHYCTIPACLLNLVYCNLLESYQEGFVFLLVCCW